MPHQCVRCNSMYEDGSEELLKGCTQCGGKFFFFMKQKDIEESKKITENLSQEDREQIEQDAFELIGAKRIDKPVVLDLESIRILKPGKFEIDLVDLFRGAPLVYKLEEGKYIIDIASSFRKRET